MSHGKFHLRINELLQEHSISKNKICKDLDIPRGKFNRYCRDEFQRLDMNMLGNPCDYFNVDVGTLIEYQKFNKE